MIYLFFLASFLIFMGKSVADICSVDSHWKQSWLGKKFSEPSFFGPKSKTAQRKEKVGTWISTNLYLSIKIANYLAHTILVPFSDIWHLANTIRRIGIYLGIFTAFNLTGYNPYVLTGGFAGSNMIGFWLMYNYVLRKSDLT
jgi:hypothetical protein